MNRKNLAALATCALVFAGASRVRGEEDVVLELKLERGHFAPERLSVLANRPFKLRVTNADPAAIEFESFELHRERVVQPGETITVFMPSLTPGAYKFFDDFHAGTPEGTLVAE